MLKKISFGWKKFWGKRFWIYKDEKEISEILIYGHKIYILKYEGGLFENK